MLHKLQTSHRNITKFLCMDRTKPRNNHSNPLNSLKLKWIYGRQQFHTYFHICSLGGWCGRRLWAWRTHSWSCSGDTFPAAFGCTGTLDSPSSLPCSMRHCGLRWDEEGKRLALLHSREPMHSSYTARSPPLQMPTPATRRCPWQQISCCTPWLPQVGNPHLHHKQIDKLSWGSYLGWCRRRKLEWRVKPATAAFIANQVVDKYLHESTWLYSCWILIGWPWTSIESGGDIYSPRFTWHWDP